MGISEGVPQEDRSTSSQDSALLLLVIYPNYTLSYHGDTCSAMFTAALFIIARNCKQPRYTSTEKSITKMWYICIIGYSLACEKFRQMGGTRNIILSEVTQRPERKKYGMILSVIIKLQSIEPQRVGIE